jgi:phosphoglycolate phosphatase-like HAD superfamily hydrolase
VFDFDGTLLDSDDVLVAPFVALGIPAEEVGRGRLLADECAHLGMTVDDYLAHYDADGAQPFPGVEELISGLDRWGVCSNKHPEAGAAELDRLGWRPTAAAFALDRPKELQALLDQLGVTADEVVYIGDTDHDRDEASAVGCEFALAGWNPRSHPLPGDRVLAQPVEVLALLA